VADYEQLTQKRTGELAAWIYEPAVATTVSRGVRMTLQDTVIVATGIGSCGAGCYLLFRSAVRLRLWASGEGVIIAYRGNGQTSWFPRVQFTLPSGEERTFESPCPASPKRIPVGSRVRVLYLPDSPAMAEVVSFFTLWLLPVGLLGFGLLIILIAFCESFAEG
jgi:hypothetical protein